MDYGSSGTPYLETGPCLLLSAILLGTPAAKAELSHINAFQGMEMPKPQANMPHVENVRLVKDATASGAGVTGFDGRTALLPLGIALLAAFVAIAYLFG